MKLKFPSYIQHDQMDCGATCLKIIAKYYRKTFSLKYLRDLCYVTREGVSLFDIGRAAETIGFRTLAIKVNFQELKAKMPLPLIVHWKQEHFVVVYKITKQKVYVSDPARGLITYKHEEFQSAWEMPNNTGNILVLETTPEFFDMEENETKASFLHFLKYLKPFQRYLIQVTIGMIAGILIGLFSPFISQSIVDFGIGSGNIKFVNTMLVAGVILAISSMLSGFIQSRLMLYISERVNMGMVSDFLRKTLYLPVPFFERKMISDLLTRIEDHDRIQSFIMSTLLGIVINILLVIVYGALMFYYEANMLFVFLAGTVVYTSWIFLFLSRRKKLDNLYFEARTKNQNDLLELLENVNEIKATNIANKRRWKWEFSRYKIYNLRIKNMNLDQVEASGATLILQLQGIFITYIAARNVIDGVMTLGMMMAAQHILGQLNGPIKSMIGYVHSYQFAKISLKRVNEIIIDEEPEKSTSNMKVPNNKSIKIRDLDFHYNPHLNKVLDTINLDIPQGKITAIVGESGSGKTTLLKLLMRFYKPTKGEISVGNISLENIGLFQWRNACGAVLQDGKMFNDTILYNITLEDEESEVDKEQLFKAVNLANISDFINERPLKLYTPLGTNGSGLSQGQKQRILIARAIYRNPDFIFLDEATNSLDANNEKEITQNLRTILSNKTAVIIAHRLSTVKNAHNIVVLDKGKVVEQGTHSELIAHKGMYYSLVANQLKLN